MIKIISNIPLFVWPLFAVLLLGGIKARKVSLVPLRTLLLVPLIFLGWSFSSFFGKYTEFSAVFFWVLSLGAGFLIGFLCMQRLKLKFEREKKMIEMPGSWIPLILSMSIFSAKFSVGMMRGMLAQPDSSMLLLGVELFSAIILGIFLGRAVVCLIRYRAFSKSLTS